MKNSHKNNNNKNNYKNGTHTHMHTHVSEWVQLKIKKQVRGVWMKDKKISQTDIYRRTIYIKQAIERARHFSLCVCVCVCIFISS